MTFIPTSFCQFLLQVTCDVLNLFRGHNKCCKNIQVTLRNLLNVFPLTFSSYYLSGPTGFQGEVSELELEPVEDAFEYEPLISSLSVLSVLICSDSLPTFLSESESNIVRRAQTEITNAVVLLTSDRTVNKTHDL